jgi:mannose-6-phosphate isomerase-like protein (cupin superfamily)
MRYLLGVLIALVAVPVYLSSQTPAPAEPRTPLSKVVFVDHDKVAGALAKGGGLVAASDVLVSGSHRDKPGQVEVHDKEMDVIYVTDGTATFVSGGKIVGAKSSRPDQWLGTDITGGTTQKLVKGDVIVVPAGTPHWFKEVPGPISYYVVKVIKP